MPLSAGTRLGPYEIVSSLGAGGMGEVYRARDPRLNREVAIKLAHGPFSERVEREARAVAALNHPNVCTLHDIGANYLVMELVEGRTLADALRAGPLPLDESLRIAGQIIDALEAAHARGIVHRDLKPANVKIRADGSVKVLDFGLAKLADPAAEDADSAALTTAAVQATEPGTVLGTPAYMAPEQARGQNVDARADIWAFGVVLYEMLAGRRPFQGPTVTDVLAVVLTGSVDWSALPSAVPPRIHRLLRRCLERDLKRRLRDIADARLDLDGTDDPTSVAASTTGGATAGRTWLPWAVAAGAIVISASFVAWSVAGASHPPSAPPSVTRWTMPVPDPRYGGTGVALSRDGRQLVYAEWSGGQSRIMLRRVDELAARPIPGTEGGVRPFFSPDGHSIAYFQTNPFQLRRAPITGGTSIALCDANFLGGSWGDDDFIVFSSPVTGSSRVVDALEGGLMRVAASGGTPETLTTPDASKGETSHQWPQVLPGGRGVLFTIDTNAAGLDSRRVAVLDLKTRTYRVLLSGGSSARYVPTGHLVYVRGGTMYGVPFDLARLQVTGPETVVQSEVYYNPERGFADYSFSDSGLLVYMAETRIAGPTRLEIVDRDGTARPLSVPEQPYLSASLSPDGARAALAIRNAQAGTSDIWILDLGRDVLKRLTSEGINNDPIWSPDGRRLVFRSRRQADGLYWIDAEGGAPQLVRSTEVREVPSSWSPDGQTVLFVSARQGIGQIWRLPIRPGAAAEPEPFVRSASDDTSAMYSPDGRWVAYTSDESGTYQIYVRPASGGGATAISTDGGEAPRWTKGGRELLYRDLSQNQVLTVDVDTTAGFRASRPRPVVALRGLFWDVTRDGARFIVARSADPMNIGARLQIVTDWFDDLNLQFRNRR